MEDSLGDEEASASESDSVESDLLRRNELELSRRDFLTGGLLDEWREWRRKWRQSHGLDLVLSSDVLYQAAVSGSEDYSTSAAEVALTGTWVLFDAKDESAFSTSLLNLDGEAPLSLRFRFRSRQRLSDHAPSDLAGQIGAIWGTTKAFNDNGFEIPQFYLRQKFKPWNLELRYGQLAVDAQLDAYSLRGVKQSFLNRAFSGSPAVAFPRFGAGMTVHWDPDGAWDFVLAATQVQSSSARDQVDFELDTSSLFYGLQAGYNFEGFGGDPARVQGMVWYSDAVPEAGLSSGYGVSLVIEQQLKAEGMRLFGRAAYAEKQATDSDLMLAVGLGKDFCEDDLLGVAVGTGRGTVGGDWQGVIECFYRWQVSPYIHITPDVQILFGDGFNGGDRVWVLPGIRGRIAF